jgi:hypothetical protein
MTNSNSASAGNRTLTVGFIVGALIALGFALMIRWLPSSLFEELGPRIIMYVAFAASAPALIIPLRLLAPRWQLDPEALAWSAIGGALLFDGFALGFFPGLYGQSSAAQPYLASALLWAFGWNVVTALAARRR